MTIIWVENGLVVTPAGMVPGPLLLTLEAGRIAAMGRPPQRGDADDGVRIDLNGGWLVPGFIDTQVNGGGGVLFNDDITVDAIRRIGAAHARYGTTAFLPTLITDTREAIERALAAVEAAMAECVPGVAGLHLEGPFINPARKGIHAEAHIRKLEPELVDLLCRPRDFPILLTLAPELADRDDLVRLAEAGILLSIGHSDASYEQAMESFRLGVRGVTHLFNAMSPLHHRAPGVVGAAFDAPDIRCGLIADGIHAAPAVIRIALRVLGTDRIMLVTDAMPGVGTDGKSFMLDGREIRINGVSCTDEDGTIAGSNLDMASALRNLIAFTGTDMSAASRMASAVPAAFLGLGTDRGAIDVGQRADFVVLDAGMDVMETWIGGVRAWAR